MVKRTYEDAGTEDADTGASDTQLVLVGGGARSGKTAYAEELARSLPGPRAYVATAEPFDDELRARIDRHRADRGDAFDTVEAPLDLATPLRTLPHPIVVVDCLTVWLGNLLHHDHEDLAIERAIDELADTARARIGTTVLVINEVGLGIVPDSALVRRFRDHSGRAQRRFAERADRVVFCLMGVRLQLTPTLTTIR